MTNVDAVSGRELVLAHLRGTPVPRVPAMPITMMFAAKLAGVPYEQYCRDHTALVRAQTLVAERFGFDHVSAISDPAREAADVGAALHWFPDQPGRSTTATPCWRIPPVSRNLCSRIHSAAAE